MKQKSGLFLALEEEAALDAATPLLEEVVPAADTAETDLLAGEAAATEVEGGLAEIDAVAADGDELTAIADKLEDSLETGGVSEETADMAQVAVEAIYERLQVSAPAMPAMESFGEKGNRLAATRLAMESIRETAGKIWKAILLAIQKVTNWIKAKWALMFDANVKQGARATKLKEALNGLKDQKPKSATIPAGGFAHTLAVGGKLDAGKLAATIGDMTNEAKALNAVIAGAVAMLSDFGKTAKSLNDQAAFDAITLDPPPASNFKAVGSADGFAASKDGFASYFRGPELPGNKCIVIYGTVKQAKGADALRVMGEQSFSIGDFNPKAAKGDVKDVPVLGKPNMEKILTEVIAASAAIGAAKAEGQKLVAARDTFANEIKMMATAAGKDDTDGAYAKRVSAVQRAGQGANRYTAGAITATAKVVGGVSKAALDYVEKSMAQYGAAAAAPAPAPAAAA